MGAKAVAAAAVAALLPSVVPAPGSHIIPGAQESGFDAFGCPNLPGGQVKEIAQACAREGADLCSPPCAQSAAGLALNKARSSFFPLVSFWSSLGPDTVCCCTARAQTSGSFPCEDLTQSDIAGYVKTVCASEFAAPLENNSVSISGSRSHSCSHRQLPLSHDYHM